MNKDLIKKMLAAGVHFGHRASRWHPKMKPYIFTKKNDIHIIDLDQTAAALESALKFMVKLKEENKNILFIGTKAQCKEEIKKLATEIEMPYVTEKWMGGTLTNFTVVKKSINKFTNLVSQKAAGKLSKYTKKEQLEFDRDIEKLELKVGGLVSLTKVPDALFVWDIKKEITAIKEALNLKIPIIAICDTNTNPTGIKYIIPANDDSTKGLKLILDIIKKTFKK